MPSRDSAPHRLIRALERIIGYQTPVQLNPAVSEYFRELAPFQNNGMRDRFLDIEDAAIDQDFLRNLDPGYRALLRDTIAVTIAQFGLKINYVPDRATAELDCRLVPGSDPDEFMATLADVIGDPNIDMEPLLVARVGLFFPGYSAVRGYPGSDFPDRQTRGGRALRDPRFQRQPLLKTDGCDRLRPGSLQTLGLSVLGSFDQRKARDSGIAVRHSFSLRDRHGVCRLVTAAIGLGGGSEGPLGHPVRQDSPDAVGVGHELNLAFDRGLAGDCFFPKRFQNP